MEHARSLLLLLRYALHHALLPHDLFLALLHVLDLLAAHILLHHRLRRHVRLHSAHLPLHPLPRLYYLNHLLFIYFSIEINYLGHPRQN